MESPRLSGFRKGTRGYEVTADAALQDVRKPSLIELERMRGHIATDDQGGIAWLSAATGLFDSAREALDLKTDVRIRTDKGEEARLQSAAVVFKTGSVTSREPVTVSTPRGTVVADGLDVVENGKQISFLGNVHVVITNDEKDKPPLRVLTLRRRAGGRAAMTGKGLCLVLAAGLLLAAPAWAEKAAPKKDGSPFGNLGGGSKEPIKIDADRLDVFDKENKAIFIGNVVAIQGESTVRCSTMTVFYKRGKDAAAKPRCQDCPTRPRSRREAPEEPRRERHPEGGLRRPGDGGAEGSGGDRRPRRVRPGRQAHRDDRQRRPEPVPERHPAASASSTT